MGKKEKGRKAGRESVRSKSLEEPQGRCVTVYVRLPVLFREILPWGFFVDIPLM